MRAMHTVFVCPGCGTDEDLSYNTQEDMLCCDRCRVRVSRHDAVSGEPLWITKDGRVYAVKDMSTSHIQNCIGNILVRGGSWRGNMLAPLVNELEKRERT
jgi:uncharacterized protein YbaR (Trm112 family)